MVDAPDAKFCRFLDEHCTVVDIEGLFRQRCGQVKGQAVNVTIGLPQVDKTGGDKSRKESLQLELPYAVHGQFAAFIAHCGKTQSIMFFEGQEEINGLLERLGLVIHEAFEFLPAETPLEVSPAEVNAELYSGLDETAE